MRNLDITNDQPGTVVDLGGAPVDLMPRAAAISVILAAASEGARGGPPLAVASANLDHLHHFGRHGRWATALTGPCDVRWLTLLDGHPHVTRARRLDGRPWPQLAGSDLIEELLDESEQRGTSVGFLGGTTATHARLQERIALRWPRLVVKGYWAPERAEITDPARARALAHTVAAAGPQMLFVGFGKPRQELWITEHGAASGASALLAFGASADFVAGSVQRAPEPIPDLGMEWLWRLALEPRRMAKRYLVQGPPAYADLWMHSRPRPTPATTVSTPPAGRSRKRGRVTAVVVTYNSADHIGALLDDLHGLHRTQHVRVVVVDNGSEDDTREVVEQRHVELIDTDANLGYAGAINVGLRSRGDCDAVLVLNPDLRIEPGALDSMWQLMRAKGAGAVVPRMFDGTGALYESLRFEPSLLGGIGEALMGSRVKNRPAWLADIDRDPQSYQFPHPIEWATGAAVLIDERTVRTVGPWNEDFFLYCEETDYFRRVRDSGATVWFDPGALVTHDAHGSGSNPTLDALMAVNRVRYAEMHRSAAFAVGIRAVAAACELLRVTKGEQHRVALQHLLRRSTWDELPHATRPAQPARAPVSARSTR